MMKLDTIIPYLKKIQKIYDSRDITPEFCWYQHFFTRNQQILIYQEIKIEIAFCGIISDSFNFSWVFKDFFNEPGYNLAMMSAKMATSGLLKITVFWNKVVNKWWRHNSCRWCHQKNLITWFKFANSSISTREVITTLIL